MPQIGKQGFNPYLHKPIPKHKIERAIQENDSMTKAAQSLHVAYNTFKKYAKHMIYGNRIQVMQELQE